MVVVVSGVEVVDVVVVVEVVEVEVVVWSSEVVVAGGTKVVDEVIVWVFKLIIWSSIKSPLEDILLV